MFVLHAEGTQVESPREQNVFYCIFSILELVKGLSLAKNGQFLAPFSTDGTKRTFFFFFSFISTRKLELQKVTEVGLKFKKHLKKCIFTIVKEVKMPIFPKYLFKRSLNRTWPHAWLCHPYFRTILTFFHNFTTPCEHCGTSAD